MCLRDAGSAMLQFLQCKMFGNQKVPEGWIIVAAGNPPEYNKSVREFDTVTLDRIRRIDVEEDYGVWREYAYQADIHPAILPTWSCGETISTGWRPRWTAACSPPPEAGKICRSS